MKKKIFVKCALLFSSGVFLMSCQSEETKNNRKEAVIVTIASESTGSRPTENQLPSVNGRGLIAESGIGVTTVTSETLTSETEGQTEISSAEAPPHFEASGGYPEDIKTVDTSMGVLLLCNKEYRLPDTFVPDELVDIPENYHVKDGKEYKLQKEAADAFIEMSDAAFQESGQTIDLRIISGYRSHSYQEWLYNNYASQYGREEADTYSARPGHSEHETGLCCDINIVDNEFERTEDFKWLVQNAANYGFILRYPKGKEHITGYMYESWHWRYVGVETALAVVESGLTYDEYYKSVFGE